MDERNLTCGFCRYGGDHTHCPGGVWSNNHIYICDCGCPESKIMRCIECNYREQGEVNNWKCIDRDACDARINVSRNKIRELSNPIKEGK